MYIAGEMLYRGCAPPEFEILLCQSCDYTLLRKLNVVGFGTAVHMPVLRVMLLSDSLTEH